ncbi:MAG: ABC transporter substrate-binding protein [Chloroflexi bacterium]|nr:ABC transporter substrate-binding protein [Chloroflexota bacterium]
MKKLLWLVSSGMIVLSVLIAACGPAATIPTAPTTPAAPETPSAPAAPAAPAAPTTEKPQQEAVKPAPEAPKYGGTLTQSLSGDVARFDPFASVSGEALIHQELWMGDWAKGIAGGYGAGETDWNMSSDLFHLKKGFIAEDTKWIIDDAKNEGTIIYQIRQGIHYGLNPASEASRLVGGREVTADDVVATLIKRVTDPSGYLYLSNPELKVAKITKTGPWEVTVKLPLPALISGITRLTDSTSILPPEVWQKYGDLANWRNAVGAGPFMLAEYVPGSAVVFVRNPNYWEKDPIGPGKGNQLPYLDGVKRIIIPDNSTRLAALRTGKIDILGSVTWEEAINFRKTTPALKEQSQTSADGRGDAIKLPVDRAPFNDVRVRRAMFMATDLKAIAEQYFGGFAQWVTIGWSDTKDYHAIYLGLNDPEMSELGRELYTYNPEKARQLLKEAGYPNGFKTSILLTATQVDFFSIIKDMWAKVGIDLKLDVRETTVVNNIKRSRTHEALTQSSGNPVGAWYLGINVQGASEYNTGMLDDPAINDALDRARRLALTDANGAMRIYKVEISKRLLEQAYNIPLPNGYRYDFWWPWLKGYSGETHVGYQNLIWPYYIWYDTALKKSMGF